MEKRTDRSTEAMAARIVPCITVRASEAPQTLGISLSLWNTLVFEGHLPRPFSPPGHTGVSLYDVDDIRAAVRNWKDAALEKNHADEIK